MKKQTSPMILVLRRLIHSYFVDSAYCQAFNMYSFLGFEKHNVITILSALM